MITGDFHTHSNLSHGKATPEQIVAAAKQKGLQAVAITDHGLNQIFCGISQKQFFKLRKQAQLLEDKYQIKVLVGLEGNVSSLNGDIGISDDISRMCDVVAVGFHDSIYIKNVASFFNFYLPLVYVSRLTKHEKGLYAQKFTSAIVNAVKRHQISFLSHLNHCVYVDIQKVAQAASDYGVAIELNEKRVCLLEPQIKLLQQTNVQFIANSDAHTAQAVGVFDNCLAFANRHKIQNNIINWGKLPQLK